MNIGFAFSFSLVRRNVYQHRLSDILRGYEKRALGPNGLKYFAV